MKAGFYLPDLENIRKYFNYLYSLERSSMKYDLKNIRMLLKALGNPHEEIKFIHIAGTNGKGGTASFLASILTEHSLKTGLFTSPHILRYNERIRINGKTIPNSYIKSFLDRNKGLIKKIKPSFFEVNTAIAFRYFADKKVDAAVIETGLGGRLDSTNIVSPELVIITQIGIDHTDYLGNTLREIAKEKLGIVKPGIDVIVSDANTELKKIFRQKIKPEHLLYLDDIAGSGAVQETEKETKFSSRINLRGGKYRFSIVSPLPGTYQLRNINTAVIAALLFLKNTNTRYSLSAVYKGIKKVRQNTGYMGRFESFKINGVNFILDVSHNPAGIKTALSNFRKSKPDIIIFAMMSDKDYKSSIKLLINKGDKIIFTQPAYKRAIPAAELYNYSLKIKPHKKSKFQLSKNVRDAITQVKKTAGKRQTVLIIGSFFLVSEAIKALKIQKHFT